MTALAKLKMLRKKYPCHWPGKRDGTHATSNQRPVPGWLVPGSLCARVLAAGVPTGAMSSEGCLPVTGDASGLDPSVPSSLHEFNRERMGRCRRRGQLPLISPSVTPGTEGTCCINGPNSPDAMRTGPSMPHSMFRKQSECRLWSCPVNPFLTTCAGFRVALPPRESLESSKVGCWGSIVHWCG